MIAKRLNLSFFIKYSILSLFITLHFPASSKQENTVKAQFNQVITEINQTLMLKQQDFTNEPELLVEFVDDFLLAIWSSEKTLKGLLGKKIWENLSNLEKKQLISAFNDTLQRYVQEGFVYYDGQQVDLLDVKLNPKRTKGLITVRLTPKILPSFEIHFKINLIHDKWYLYDILLQGVSYISLKREGYREMINSNGISAFLDVINNKNKGYRASRVIK